MSDEFLLSFKNKRERNDFFIALFVLGLFFSFLMYNMDSCNFGKNDLVDAKLGAVGAVVGDVVADSIATLDTDNDGIINSKDKCPELPGLAENGGCPNDRDGDGIFDAEDKCPRYKGTAKLKGCPPDTDKDGLHDKIDKCPNLVGIVKNDGCPSDKDGDGVWDSIDDCPYKSGKKENNGCPEIKVDDTERALLERAIHAVEFKTGSAALTGASPLLLDDIAAIMNKYSNYKIRISGHTDNVGDPQENLILSEERAKACGLYLASKGIDPYRITYTGYGETAPVADNATKEGKALNRRVNFDLHY